MKPSLAYIRCSSDEQTADSVPRQRAEIERWSTSNGYHVQDVFIDDGVSGTIPLGERPAGSKLIKEIERRLDVQFVIIWEYSRWGRDADPEQIYFWELYLNRLNVKLISLDNPELTFRSAMERGIMRFVQRQASSQENKSKSLRSYSGAKRNIELGYLNTNTPPYGYSRAAKNLSTGEVRVLARGETIQKRLEKPYLAICEAEVSIVRRIFEMRAKGLSIRRIAQLLNEETVPSPKNKLWRKNVLNRIIANPVYYGAACWGKTTSSRIMAYENGTRIRPGIRKFLRATDSSGWILNEHAGLPAIVDKALWMKANSVTSTERRVRGRTRSSGYLLSGLVYDSETRSAMVGSNGGQYRRKDQTVLKKRYYVNSNWHSQGILRGVRSVDADALEVRMVELLSDYLKDGRIAGRLEDTLLRYIDSRKAESENGKEAQRLSNLIAERDAAIANLVRAIEGAPEVSALVVALKAAQREKEVLEVQRMGNPGSGQKWKKLPSKAEIGQIVARFLVRFEEVFSGAEIEEKKGLIRQWVEKIEISQSQPRKKARAVVRLLPRIPEFDAISIESVLCGPCRARTCDPQIMSLPL